MQDQRGMASLITVVLTSFVILILTIATANMMTNEVQQSTDAENSVKAYFAAQSASEESIAAIKSEVENAGTNLSGINQGCSSDQSTSKLHDFITCRVVRDRADVLDSTIAKDQTIRIDLSNAFHVPGSTIASTINTVVLEWDRDPRASSAFTSPSYVPKFTTGEGIFTAQQIPPLMEVTVANYTLGRPGTLDPSSGSILLVPQCKPTSASSSTPCPDYGGTPTGVSFSANRSTGGTAKPVGVQCYRVSIGQDRCKVELKDIATGAGFNPFLKTVVTLRPRYSGASYHFKAYDNTSATKAVEIPLSNAQVDVTTKVGQSFRRTVIEVPVRSNPYSPETIYGDIQVCKDYEVLFAPGYSATRQTSPCPISTTDEVGN